MRIKSISIGDKGKKLSISWYSGEEDNTLNTISGTDKPLPTFKEAWDALAASIICSSVKPAIPHPIRVTKNSNSGCCPA